MAMAMLSGGAATFESGAAAVWVMAKAMLSGANAKFEERRGR